MSPDVQQSLLELARSAMNRALAGLPVEDPPACADRPIAYGGLFVSLHLGPALRGCIGTFAPRTTIEQTVQEMSLAALRDPRFSSHPVMLEELPDLQIEISVLSVPQPTDDPMSMRVGHHGIVVERRDRSGCFLPQVALRQGWSAERTLDECCTQKAHLPKGAWKGLDTRVLFFTAESFADSPPNSRLA